MVLSCSDMNNFEYKGVWWLPETPSHQIAGDLAFTQKDGFKLELIGLLKPIEEGIMKFHQSPLINGLTVDGKIITLVNCFQNHHSISTNGIHFTKYIALIAYEGIWFEKIQELAFNKVFVKYTYLWDWVGITGITREHSPQGLKHSFTYVTPEDIEIETAKGKVSLTFSANIKSQREVHNVSESTSFSIEMPEEREFNKISNDFLFPIQSLITLGTTKANFIEELYFIKESVYQYPIKVYYQQRFYQPKSNESLNPDDVLFTLGDIYEGIENLFNNWLDIAPEIDEVLRLFFRNKIAPDLYLELRFLTIAQAAETFHRRKRKGAVLPKEEHKEKMEKITKRVAKKYVAWLKQALAFSNEKSLKIRLDELMEESAEVMNPLTQNDKESFIKKVRDTRNYFTHYDKRMKKNASDGSNLRILTEKLSILLQSCLLKEIDIKPEDQVGLFNRNKYYNHLKRQ
jgi:hypothetical protein